AAATFLHLLGWQEEANHRRPIRLSLLASISVGRRVTARMFARGGATDASPPPPWWRAYRQLRGSAGCSRCSPARPPRPAPAPRPPRHRRLPPTTSWQSPNHTASGAAATRGDRLPPPGGEARCAASAYRRWRARWDSPPETAPGPLRSPGAREPSAARRPTTSGAVR